MKVRDFEVDEPTNPVALARKLLREFHRPCHCLDELIGTHQRLWALEDECRSPCASDGMIGGLKRQIDDLNARRHEIVDRIDSTSTDDGHGVPARIEPAKELARLYQLTIGEFADAMVVAQLKLDNLRSLSEDRLLNEQRREQCSRMYLLGIEKSRHNECLVEQLVGDLRSGRLGLPPRADPKLYNHSDFRRVR